MNEFNFKILSNLPLDDADIKLLKDYRKGQIQGMIYFAIISNAIMLIMFLFLDTSAKHSIFTISVSNLTLLTTFVLIIKTECNINKIIIAKKNELHGILVQITSNSETSTSSFEFATIFIKGKFECEKYVNNKGKTITISERILLNNTKYQIGEEYIIQYTNRHNIALNIKKNIRNNNLIKSIK